MSAPDAGGHRTADPGGAGSSSEAGWRTWRAAPGSTSSWAAGRAQERLAGGRNDLWRRAAQRVPRDEWDLVAPGAGTGGVAPDGVEPDAQPSRAPRVPPAP